MKCRRVYGIKTWLPQVLKVLLAPMHCYYTSFAENCIPFTILNLLCVSSYFQSNYYILEICIREIILHILWCAVACSSN